MGSNEIRIHAGVKDDVSGPLDKMRDKFDQLGKSKGAQSILQGVGVGAGIKAFDLLSGAASHLTGAFTDAIDKGSALSETQGKVSVVFGKSAAAVEQWGNSTARNMGISKQAAEEAAGSLGNLFLGAGVGQDKLAGLSESVVKLASDLASFNNLDPADVLDKLRSGLVGEAEPLRVLGVNLTAAQTEAEATALGFQKVNGVFTEGEKIQARYSLIMKATTTAQGDFARTADGLANSQRKLNAQMDDFQAKLGQKVTPILAGAASQLSAAFDVIDNGAHADALVEQTKAFTLAGYSTETYANALKGVTKQLEDAMASGKATDQELTDIATVMKLLNDATKLTQGTVATAASGFGGFANKANSAFTGLQNVTSAMKGVTSAALAGYKPTHDYFDIYTAVATKGDIAQTTLDLMDDRTAIDDAKKAMDKATPGTQAYKKAQLELAVAQGRLASDTATLHTKQAELFLLKPDKANTAAIGKWFKDLGLNVADLTGDLKLAYDAFYRLTHPDVKGGSTVQFNVSWGGKRLAGGGSLDRGEPAIIGEHGSEWFVPDVPGTVLPHGVSPRGGGSGGSLSVNVMVNAGNGIITPGAAVDIGNAVGPVILKWMQRNGAVPMTGTPQSG